MEVESIIGLDEGSLDCVECMLVEAMRYCCDACSPGVACIYNRIHRHGLSLRASSIQLWQRHGMSATDLEYNQSTNAINVKNFMSHFVPCIAVHRIIGLAFEIDLE